MGLLKCKLHDNELGKHPLLMYPDKDKESTSTCDSNRGTE